MLKKNDIVKLEITGTSFEGNGVGRADHFVVFVPGSVKGDVINAKILSLRKNYAYGKIQDILKPSDSRVSPDCTAFLKCGGCVFRHVDYREETSIKWQRVRDTLQKIGRLDLTPEPLLPCENTLSYRNKAQYPVAKTADGRLVAGFFAPRSHRVVPCSDCKLQPPVFEKVVAAILNWAGHHGIEPYNEETGAGVLRHIYLRQAHATGELMACVVVNTEQCPHKNALVEELTAVLPDISSIIINVNRERTNVILGRKCITVWGGDYITDRLCGLKIEISPLSFYQVNSPQTEKLYGIAADFAALEGQETLLDLYCGAGTIGLSMAGRVKQLIGVEVVPQAVDDAKKNAKANNITNTRFICADAGEATVQLEAEGISPDVVILDPPRKGCEKDTIDAVCRFAPSRVVYVSCDPATLARDLAIFRDGGYVCRRVKPVDMFPRTSHVECVVLMSRVKD